MRVLTHFSPLETIKNVETKIAVEKHGKHSIFIFTTTINTSQSTRQPLLLFLLAHALRHTFCDKSCLRFKDHSNGLPPFNLFAFVVFWVPCLVVNKYCVEFGNTDEKKSGQSSFFVMKNWKTLFACVWNGYPFSVIKNLWDVMVRVENKILHISFHISKLGTVIHYNKYRRNIWMWSLLFFLTPSAVYD